MTTVTNNSAPVATDIRDIKPPMHISSAWEFVGIAAAVLVALVLLFVLWRWWRKRRARVPVVPPVPAHVRARAALEKALELIAQPKPFCILVSDTVRLYLEERFNFRAPERTTEEFLRELNATDRLADNQKESLGRFLESCDLVKFAKYEPGETELRQLHGSATQLVEETEPKGDATGRVDPEQIVNRQSPIANPK